MLILLEFCLLESSLTEHDRSVRENQGCGGNAPRFTCVVGGMEVDRLGFDQHVAASDD